MTEGGGRGDEIAAGLAERLRTVLLSLDRQDRLETAQSFVGWLTKRHADGAIAADAREMLLRALRLASDPINYEILRLLKPDVAIELHRVMEKTGLERVATSERLHDLAQVGLAVRELVGDQIRGTQLSSGLVAVVEDIASHAGGRLLEALAPVVAARQKTGAGNA